MRPSKLVHPIAVLRQIAGIRSQKDLALMVGCSPESIQSIEAGPKRLKLSEALAEKISQQTGVSIDWLLAGDPKTPPTHISGRQYKKADFEIVRAELMRKDSRSPYGARQDFGSAETVFFYSQAYILGAMLSALEKDQIYLMLYRLRRFTTELNNEFGLSPEVLPALDLLNKYNLRFAECGKVSTEEFIDTFWGVFATILEAFSRAAQEIEAKFKSAGSSIERTQRRPSKTEIERHARMLKAADELTRPTSTRSAPHSPSKSTTRRKQSPK